MAIAHLRPITKDNIGECLRLELAPSQSGLVASNAVSLAEAYVNPNLTPLGVYDIAAQGYDHSLPVPMIGFVMYEIVAGVGFIQRLMIDQTCQRQGYGRAVMQEVTRRLRLNPQVEMIATSHLRENEMAAKFYSSLGFVAWNIAWAQAHETETFLRLP